MSRVSSQQKPRIGITVGDPAGIGPEIIKAALTGRRLPKDFAFDVLGPVDTFEPGKPTPESARAAAEALETAAAGAASGRFAAIVTGPVSKKALHLAGFSHPGQTEFFAAKAEVKDFAMCLTGGKLTVALVTAHIPLAEVRCALHTDEIVRVGNLLAAFLRRRKSGRPRIAVAGLNPHAGEQGDLGREEIEIIAPAVASLRNTDKEAFFSDPLPPDTVFFRAAQGEFDGVLCMYHDQGLIPLKLHAFDQGVNVTLGLPFPRTSPDHGTAFEIAGKGLARPDSMIAAIHLACELARA